MFSTEFNGYNKNEVDKYIADLKATYEKSLMEEKLKVLEAERKVLEYKNKQKNIMKVLESFKKEEAEGNRNIEILRGEQLRMIYQNLQSFLEELNSRYPGILLNSTYKKLITDIETVLGKTDARKSEIISTGTENDPMRILLSKMQDKKQQESPKEIRIERANFDRDKTSLIKPVCDMELQENDGNNDYDNLVDKFLNTKPTDEKPLKQNKLQQTSGFDFMEAVNPHEDLNEIMKAFDFFNDENNKPKSGEYNFDD